MKTSKRKVYNYTNDLGRKREIWITKYLDSEEYGFSIWDMGNGELTNSGSATAEQLTNFLANYGIKFEAD